MIIDGIGSFVNAVLTRFIRTNFDEIRVFLWDVKKQGNMRSECQVKYLEVAHKIKFYIDFLSYRESGMAISGLAYNAIDFGPVPQRWDRVYSAFDEIVPLPKLVRDQESTALTASVEPDMACFTEQERAIIDTVCAKMKDLSAHDISELSHKEPAWQRHLHQVETIPFEEAFSLEEV